MHRRGRVAEDRCCRAAIPGPMGGRSIELMVMDHAQPAQQRYSTDPLARLLLYVSPVMCGPRAGHPILQYLQRRESNSI